MIEVKNLNKSFAGNQVLTEINTSFEKGKVNLIIGQSGHGKSVLAKCMVGLHEVDSGQIIFNGRDFCAMDRIDRTEIRKEIGMLFQGSALFDSMTVEENVMFPLSMFTKMSKKEMQQRADFCLDRVNLTKASKLFPAECSGGMQKRIGIARAIAMNPKYLFCDEPNSGLDPQTSIVIDELIKEITEDYKMTTIINTHDMNTVMESGDHILYMHNGVKQWEGSSKDIFTSQDALLNNFVFASSMLRELREFKQR